MSHVLNLDVGDSTRKLVLVGLANHADKSGRCAFPSLTTVAAYACCSKRTVQRHIAVLLNEGRLREGDQRLVAHLPKDRRPVVYDVAMNEDERAAWQATSGEINTLRAFSSANGSKGVEAKAKAAGMDVSAQAVQDESSESARGDNLTPRSEEVRGDNLSPRRGDTHDTPGVTPVTERGDTHVTQTVLEPSNEPSKDSLLNADASSGDDDGTLTLISEVRPTGPQPSFEDFWSHYPRHVGKQAARKAWDVAVKVAAPSFIVEGARRFAADPNLPTGAEAGFVPHPSSWLRAGRWDDDPLPPRASARGRAYSDAETWGTEEERITHAEAKRVAWESMTEEERQAEVDRMFGEDGSAAAHGG